MKMSIAVLCLALMGCEAGYHARQVEQAGEANGLTVGTVQREIAKGMPSATVVERLGSPNIVTTDEEGREVWVYDRTATSIVASGSSWFVSAGAATREQKTLTIVIKFDQESKVRDIAYHSSSF